MEGQSSVQPEAAIWCALCWIVICARFVSRRIALGAWKLLRLEDMLAVLAGGTGTTLMVLLTKIEIGFRATESEAGITEEQIEIRTTTLKLLVAAEQLQIITVWLMKAAMLLMYYRLTMLLAQHKQVIFTIVCVGVCFTFMEIMYFGVWCRPFVEYWDIAAPNKQCSTANHHLIVSLATNVFTDLLIITIPLPLFYKCQLPLKKKFVLLGLFVLGVFTIAAALVSKIKSFIDPTALYFAIWYLREACTAILCANLPLIYPLLQTIFKLRSWAHDSFHSSRSRDDNGSFPPSSRRIRLHDMASRDQAQCRAQIGGVPTISTTHVSVESEDPSPVKENPFESTTTNIVHTKDHFDLEAIRGRGL